VPAFLPIKSAAFVGAGSRRFNIADAYKTKNQLLTTHCITLQEGTILV